MKNLGIWYKMCDDFLFVMSAQKVHLTYVVVAVIFRKYCEMSTTLIRDWFCNISYRLWSPKNRKLHQLKVGNTTLIYELAHLKFRSWVCYGMFIGQIKLHSWYLTHLIGQKIGNINRHHQKDQMKNLPNRLNPW